MSHNNEATALSLACSSGHQEIAQLLLQSGASTSLKLKDGSTCIIEAAKGGHTAVVELLLNWNSRLSLPFASANPVCWYFFRDDSSFRMRSVLRVPWMNVECKLDLIWWMWTRPILITTRPRWGQPHYRIEKICSWCRYGYHFISHNI